MNLAVFSDIHANSLALETCVRFAEHLGAEEYVFLGDLLTDGPDPHGTISFLREFGRSHTCTILRGKRESDMLRARIGKIPVTKRNGMQYDRFVFTSSQLTEEDWAFLSTLGETAVLSHEGYPDIFCEHMPNGAAVELFPGTEAADIFLRSSREKVRLIGYSHMQFRYEAFGSQIINPGSVGMPARGFRKARFALVSGENGRVSARMLNVDYDIVSVEKQFLESELYLAGGAYAKVLQRAYHCADNRLDDCLRLVCQYSHQEDPLCAEERFWDMAARELRII